MTEQLTAADGADVKAITAALSAPFDPTEVKWKPQAVKGDRALALAYVDARLVQDRLDCVLGVEGWQDDYEILPDGSVTCKLRLKLGDQWVTKMDVGGPSEQPDGGDRLKAAFSDALKRAAVKFGLGRYLYRLKAEWTAYDPIKKQFVHPPRLPDFAIPGAAEKRAEKRSERPVSARKPAIDPATSAAAHALPATGDELHRRLRDYDAKLADRKLCGVGMLLSHVAQAGVRAGYGEDIARWAGPAIPFAVEAVKEFETLHCHRKSDEKQTAA